jgi:hypothetical protein
MSNPVSDISAAFTGGSAIANLAGGGKGASPQNVNFPPFYSSGGITPEQQALADYGLDEANVATGAAFGNSGTGMSTMATQAGTGNRMGKAIAEGTMSNTDEDAMLKAYENEQTAATQSLSNQSTLSNLATQQLTNAITQGGKAATTAAGNSDFSQGAADIFNSTG